MSQLAILSNTPSTPQVDPWDATTSRRVSNMEVSGLPKKSMGCETSASLCLPWAYGCKDAIPIAFLQSLNPEVAVCKSTVCWFRGKRANPSMTPTCVSCCFHSQSGSKMMLKLSARMQKWKHKVSQITVWAPKMAAIFRFGSRKCFKN